MQTAREGIIKPVYCYIYCSFQLNKISPYFVQYQTLWYCC